VDDLVVDDELAAAVVDDEGTDWAAAVAEGALNLAEETVVVDDGQTLLDVAGLGHADEETVITDVKDAVLLEDGAEHALHVDRGLGVGVEAGLFLELLGEEIDTEVAVLAGLGRQADADDLAWAALQDDEVTHANEVAGDSDGVEARHIAAGLDEADLITTSVTGASGTGDFFDGFLATVVNDFTPWMVVVVMVAVGERVEQAIGSTFYTTAEAVVVTFVVVIAHITLWLVELDALFLDYLGGRSTTLVFDVVGVARATTVVSLGLVDLVADFSVVNLTTIVLDVDFSVLVRSAGSLVSAGRLANVMVGRHTTEYW
jgi:hypothetical protein